MPQVLHVNHTSIVGGAERSLLELMTSRKERSCLACPAGPLVDEATRRGVTVEVLSDVPQPRLRMPRLVYASAHILRVASGVAQSLRKTGFDVIHANTLRASISAAYARTWEGTPLVTHVRDIPPRTALYWGVRSTILLSADELVAVSNYAASAFALSSLGKPIHVVDNPVDASRLEIRPTSVQPGGPPSPNNEFPRLGIIGQISPWKGHDFAIAVLGRLTRHFPNARLLIAGDVSFQDSLRFNNIDYMRSLQDMVRDLNLSDRVDFLGFQENVAEVLESIDMLLVPSTAEPFGRVVAEALLMNTPVAGTAIGGPAEIIRPGVDGIVLPPGDADQWADEIARFLHGGNSGPASRPYAEKRFSPQRHLASMEAIFASAIRNR